MTVETIASTVPAAVVVASSGTAVTPHAPEEFIPAAPRTLAESGLNETEVEALVLKQLFTGGILSGRKISEVIKLPFAIVQEVLRTLKAEMLIAYRNSSAMGDYEIELTAAGDTRARWHIDRCTYCGAAPVTLGDYKAGVEKQSVHKCKPKVADLVAAFADISLSPELLSSIGQAVNAGRGMFIYGAPGNGKTSIAERIIRALSPFLWIPRTITIGGEIIRLFDPANHEEAPLAGTSGLLTENQIDRRWVRIKRPAVIVGGELTFAQLDLVPNTATGIIEAPVQLKANGGTLVVDDFGRQRVSTTELLNRWIVPLEKRFDYLALPSGRQIQVPFDQLIVFSTNLEPQSLCDEAFLRRIPYKIEVADPKPAEFREILRRTAAKLGLAYNEAAVDYLLQKHFVEARRPLRYCHPRDLLLQVKNLCEFHELPLELSKQAFDIAVVNYFNFVGRGN